MISGAVAPWIRETMEGDADMTPKTMKALVRTRYGPPEVLRLEETEVPAYADEEVLVRVLASSLNKADMFSLRPPLMIRLIAGAGRLRPKHRVFGLDLAGVVEEVGGNVKHLKPGDEVFGCGSAAFAEYGCAREDALALKPTGAAFEEFAALPVAGVTALQALRKAKVRPGQKVLIDGASGGVGIFAVQIAKALGADVTAVCSTSHVEDLRAMGADRVMDYTKEDFETSGQKYDAIIGVNGGRSFLGYRRALSDKGTYVMAGSSRPVRNLLPILLLSRLLSRGGGKQIGFLGIARVNSDDLAVLRGFVEAGRVVPLDRRYTLEEARDAFRYFAEGHARGKVVITIASSSI